MLERIVSIITPVILIILVGWLYGRKAHPDMAGINRATLDVIAPLLVVSAFVSKEFVLADQVALLACAVGVVLGSGLLALGAARLMGADPRTFVPPMMFNNSGNMGLPLSVFAFGPAGLAPAVALFAASNLMHFTLGLKIVNRHASLAQISRNPMVLATIAGVGLSLARPWFALPDPVYQSIKLLGDATVPLMLFALGVRMKDVNLRNWGMGLAGAVICPLTGITCALALAAVVPLTELQRGLLFVFAALPPAVLNFLVADHFRQEPDQVASIVLLGNIAAVVFVPVGLYLGLR
ncbi:AEC family transporter [Cupriavidus gilardii]|uniref:AEC family transporter n=1 Tax=Cupriavidus gilardii TaxID=82541 RepID=A0A849BC04_9BURK|nr:AEC family transporter [Cupriavidus gilardii]KAB0597190.1 AEC family transporter [Cupriavidus gilardii]MCT9012326.1 AEC family transporter [Cupriavidus gilardii]MCT9053537.1 AEC family transporter [Cupriavidus gilardii]NNH11718.1 AEC family transporter [Cupriavidus gilardii]USE81009.1 AEC family transporter [Cupriavidus gilardii]